MLWAETSAHEGLGACIVVYLLCLFLFVCVFM